MKLYISIALACLGLNAAHGDQAPEKKSEFVPQLRGAKTSEKPSDKSEHPIFSRKDGLYNTELARMASNITHLSMNETESRRELQTIDGEDWDLDSIDNFLQCAADTDLMYTYNPVLYNAVQLYATSASYTTDFDPSSFAIITNIYYSQEEAEIILAQCALAGGYFDINVGALNCEYMCSDTYVYGYVNCLANTPECRAKGNYEYLEYALELEGFSNCNAPDRPAVTMPPTPAPLPATLPPTTLPPTPAPLPVVISETTTNLTESNPPPTNITSVVTNTTTSLANCSAAPECISEMKFNFTGKACPPSSGTCQDFGNITIGGFYQFTLQDALGGTVYSQQVSLAGLPVTFSAAPVIGLGEEQGPGPFCFDRLIQVSVIDLSQTVLQTSLISSSCNTTTGIGKVFMTDEYGAFEFLGFES